MADWGDKFMEAWTVIKKKAGGCAANTDIEEVKASVELGKKRIDQALFAGSLLQKGDSKVFERLSKANEGLGKIGETLGTVQDVCLDITAVGKIHDAAVALSDDRLIYDNPEGAAAAFDSMFQGFGRLCRYLPPPAKSWQQFFESFNLFGAMTPKLVPELRWKEQFKQVDGWQ